MRLRVFANAAGNLLVEISHPSLKAGVNHGEDYGVAW